MQAAESEGMLESSDYNPAVEKSADRSVQCDEKHPLCGNCSRRFPGLASCDFETFIEVKADKIEKTLRTNRAMERASYPPLRPSMSIQPTGISTFGGSRVLELRLMHHYITSTSTQLPDAQSTRPKYAWPMDIPRLAFSSDLVLNALLGISALHYSALSPEDPLLFYASGYYFDRAVRNHRLALGNVGERSAESVLATAILITHNTWVSAHTLLASEPYELPLQTYYMARGIAALFQQMWPWLGGSGYLWYVDSMASLDDDTASYDNPFLNSSQADLTTLLEVLKQTDMLPSDIAVYEEITRELSSMCFAISEGVPQVVLQKLVATMPVRLPERFLELLKRKDPGALVLLARNLSLLQMIEPVWWLHGTGPAQRVAEISISGISKMLPDEWLWAMEWPLRAIAGKLQLQSQTNSSNASTPVTED